MAINVWWHAVGVESGTVRSALDALAGVGIASGPWSEQRSGACLLFYSGEVRAAEQEVLRLAPESDGRIIVVSVDAAGEVGFDDASLLLGAGAGDVCAWSEDGPQGVLAQLQRWGAVDSLASSEQVRSNLVGSGSAWQRFLRELIEAAHFSSAPVLITGETGTGKELAARLVHALDARASKGQMVVSDCTTIVPELAGSELFGHERGAFTGSAGAREGAFALAGGGTLFLDEIGELPLRLQGQLLRAVQEKTYKQVGGNEWRRSEFRLVCATNRNLLAEVEQGRFRRDLYYRIAGAVCRAPPLRERSEDILSLTAHFLKEFLCAKQVPPLSAPVRAYLLGRDYPGNVRDLRQLVQGMARRYLGCGPLTFGTIPASERGAADQKGHWRGKQFEDSVRRALDSGVGLKEIGRAAEDTALRLAVARCATLKEAAAQLAVTQRAVQMRRSGVRDDRARQNGVAGAEELA